MEEYTKLKEIIDNCADDIEKFQNGNKSAGTRIRKSMQEIKKQAQEVRLSILKNATDKK